MSGEDDVEILDIALTADSGYLPHALALIRSVAACVPRTTVVRVWLFTDPRPEHRQAAIERGVRLPKHVSLRVLPLPSGLNALPISENLSLSYLSRAMWARVLIVPVLMRLGISRFLYLDSDIICVGDISGLLGVDLAGQAVGAVRDAVTTSVGDSGGIPKVGDFPEIDQRDPYFNSGVLLIDGPAWIANDIEGRCLKYARIVKNQARYPDQDALNVALHNLWMPIPEVFNCQIPARSVPMTIRGLPAGAKLLHPIGRTKWWHAKFPDSEIRDLYWSYRISGGS